jgi:hypothetical protein
MTDPAPDFQRLGDAAFDRLAGRFPRARRRRTALEQALPERRFAALQAAMARFVAASMGEPRADVPELLGRLIERRAEVAALRPDGMLVPTRETYLEANLLHRALAAAFRDFGIEAEVDGIDLPVNVRVVFGAPAPGGGRGDLPYSSSKLHSDVWAGVPVDAVVVVVPVLGDIEHITIEAGHMAPGLEYEAMRVMPDYLEGARYQMVEKYTDLVMRHGHAYLCDARGLHQTVRRRDDGVRISIDFRFRLADPAYRAACPEVHGVESVDTRIPYDQWLAVGTDRVVVFDHTADEIARTKAEIGGAPYGIPNRVVEAFGGG